MASDIKIVMAKNIKRTSIFIDPKKDSGDVLIRNSSGKVVGSKDAENILATGPNSRAVAKELYGRI